MRSLEINPMRDNWNNLDPQNSRGPRSYGLKIIFLMFFFAAVIGAGGYVFGWFGEAAQVAQEEFGPRAMLQKYEWFKDASAQLDAKAANIDAMQARIDGMERSYTENGQVMPRTRWARTDAEQYNQWLNEVAGLKANYNSLAADYNSNMAKINFAFANQGSLPKGADKVLPREYRSYK